MKLRRCSLRKMIGNGQVDDRIKQKVLNGLKDIVITSGLHGDLKDWGKAKRALPWTLSDNQPIRIYSIFVCVNFQTSPTTCSSISILSMGVSTISKWSLQIGERRVKIRNILAALRCTRQEPRFTIITTKISSHSAVLRWSFIWTSQERDLKCLKMFDQVFDFFYHFWKVWLALTFNPIENESELRQLRALLSPFMQNVGKCGEYNRLNPSERECIVNDIIDTASSTVHNQLINRLNRVMNRTENETLNLEHNALRGMNIRCVLRVLYKIDCSQILINF